MSSEAPLVLPATPLTQEFIECPASSLGMLVRDACNKANACSATHSQWNFGEAGLRFTGLGERFRF
jgi:hypothetical protein